MNDVYVVKKGDTLYGISNQYGVSVTELASLNGVNANTLQVGQKLIIPMNSGVNPDNMFFYTVKKGDSLWSISKIYNVSVDSIKNLNYLTNNNLYIGQVLRIPEMYTKPEDMSIPNYQNYTVQVGDSLYSIAKKFNTTVAKILQDNALSNDVLSVGQNLKIRLMDSAVEECFGELYVPSIDSSLTFLEYKVVKGDSLYQIAKKFQVSVDEIMKTNNLNNINLTIGQVLKIPKKENISSYIVQKGDTLYSISKKFSTTVDDIKDKNNLISNSLTVGQLLQI